MDLLYVCAGEVQETAETRVRLTGCGRVFVLPPYRISVVAPFWIETGNRLRLAIVPRPRGGNWLEVEMAAIKKPGVDILVSMLPQDEAAELSLSDEAVMCRAAGMTYLCLPIEDRAAPESTASFMSFVEQLRAELHAGRSVAVHCRASIGRSSLLLAAVLCREGFSPADAFQRISLARGLQVPDTHEQVLWVGKFAAHV